MSIKDILLHKININMINYSLVLKKKINLILDSIQRANTVSEFNIYKFIYVHIIKDTKNYK